MVHFINFVWIAATAIFSICYLVNMFTIDYNARKGIISSETAATEHLNCFLVLPAFLAIVAIMNPFSSISLFKIILAAFH